MLIEIYSWTFVLVFLNSHLGPLIACLKKPEIVLCVPRLVFGWVQQKIHIFFQFFFSSLHWAQQQNAFW